MKSENRPCEHCGADIDERGDEEQGAAGNVGLILWTCTRCAGKRGPSQSVPRFLTREEAAAELGISPWSVYRLIRLGRLRAVRVGKYWRVAVEDLHAY